MSVSYFIPDLAPEDLHRCEEIVRRSRFIVSLAHTPTPEAAKSFIERIKQEFTANVSHELKTPLTSISGYAEMIENGMAQPEDVKKFAKPARSATVTTANRTARRAAPCSPCCCTAGSVSFPRS